MNKTLNFSWIPLTATATVAAVAFSTASAQAATISSITITGGLDGIGLTGGTVGEIDFTQDNPTLGGFDGIVTATSGGFAALTFPAFVDIISDLSYDESVLIPGAALVPFGGDLTKTYAALTDPDGSPFLDFGVVDLNLLGFTNPSDLTFSIGALAGISLEGAPGSVSDLSTGVFTGSFMYDGVFLAHGDVGFSTTGTGGYTISLTSEDFPNVQIPEPLTILGSTLALGFGGIFKKRYAKKQEQEA